jgi:hypothetical protein
MPQLCRCQLGLIHYYDDDFAYRKLLRFDSLGTFFLVTGSMNFLLLFHTAQRITNANKLCQIVCLRDASNCEILNSIVHNSLFFMLFLIFLNSDYIKVQSASGRIYLDQYTRGPIKFFLRSHFIQSCPWLVA